MLYVLSIGLLITALVIRDPIFNRAVDLFAASTFWPSNVISAARSSRRSFARNAEGSFEETYNAGQSLALFWNG